MICCCVSKLFIYS